jgi:hypothetical protein
VVLAAVMAACICANPLRRIHFAALVCDTPRSYTTEVIKNTLDPVWRPFTLKSSQLAASPDSNFRMNVIDWDSIGSHDPIGHIIITPKVLPLPVTRAPGDYPATAAAVFAAAAREN